MPASVIAERVGWVRGMTVFNERVRELRPAYLPPDPAGRTTYDAGVVAQCDLWFPPTTVPVGYGQTRSPMQLPVLTMVLGIRDGSRRSCCRHVVLRICSPAGGS
jgi:hypothetical protein